MPFATTLIGLVLIAVGLQGYFDFGQLLGVQERSPTALIPAVIGGLLTLCGLLALSPSLRKHAMHFAAMVSLIGFVGAIWRPMYFLIREGALDLSQLRVKLQLLTSALCLLLLVMCINSFILARRRRRAMNA